MDSRSDIWVSVGRFSFVFLGFICVISLEGFSWSNVLCVFTLCYLTFTSNVPLYPS